MRRLDADLQRVMRESRDCPFCEGNGQRLVFDREGRSVTAHCACSYGRWMRNLVDYELRLRIPDVTEILAGRSPWQLESPEDEGSLSRAQVEAIFGRSTWP